MITITVTRKPLSEVTVAANVLKHGCGAINIDRSRIGVAVETWPTSRSQPRDRTNLYTRKMSGVDVAVTVSTGQPPSGRWPANLVLQHRWNCQEGACTCDCPVWELDQQTPDLQPSKGAYVRKHGQEQFLQSGMGQPNRVDAPNGITDSGGASRYFKSFRPTSQVHEVLQVLATRLRATEQYLVVMPGEAEPPVCLTIHLTNAEVTIYLEEDTHNNLTGAFSYLKRAGSSETLHLQNARLQGTDADLLVTQLWDAFWLQELENRAAGRFCWMFGAGI